MLGMAKVIRRLPAAPAPRLYLAEELLRQGNGEIARRVAFTVLYGAYDSPEKAAAARLFPTAGGPTAAGLGRGPGGGVATGGIVWGGPLSPASIGKAAPHAVQVAGSAAMSGIAWGTPSPDPLPQGGEGEVSPVPVCGHPQADRSCRRGIGAEDAGAERDADRAGRGADGGAFVAVEAAFEAMRGGATGFVGEEQRAAS
eukprot:gene60575-82877_t